MAQKLADDWEPKTQAGANTRMCMARVMNAKVSQASSFDDGAPRPVKGASWLVIVGTSRLAGYHALADARKVGQNIKSRRIQHNRLFAALAVGNNKRPRSKSTGATAAAAWGPIFVRRFASLGACLASRSMVTLYRATPPGLIFPSSAEATRPATRSAAAVSAVSGTRA